MLGITKSLLAERTRQRRADDLFELPVDAAVEKTCRLLSKLQMGCLFPEALAIEAISRYFRDPDFLIVSFTVFVWFVGHYSDLFSMGVSKTGVDTSKWMVYMENPTKMDDLGVPPFKEISVSKSSLLLLLSNLEGVEGKARAAGLALLTQHCIFFTNSDSKSNMMHATCLNDELDVW